ncbi:MAG: ATP-binding cassette domain-containing protein [Desulfurococcaceae archaeon]
MTTINNILVVRNISKSFPGNVQALNKVSLELKSGEILALLGENGSGKSTLIKILYGIYLPDEGEIFLDGRRLSVLSPRDAINKGIVMIPQTPQLIDKLSVAENLLLGISKYGFFTKVSEIVETIKLLEASTGIRIDPKAIARTLTYTQKQLVEIARAITLGARILLLDEAFTYLPLEERRRFYKYLLEFKAKGNSVVLVTHKIPEALEVADRISVLRKGALVATFMKEEISADNLRYAMFGENGAKITHSRIQGGKIEGRTVIHVKNLAVMGDFYEEIVKGASLSARAGEIVGITGIAGNGQKELVEAIVGLRRVSRGSVVIDGFDVTNKGVHEVRGLGVGFIPDSPLKFGVAPDMDIISNIAVLFSRKNFLIPQEEIRKITWEIINDYQITAKDEGTPVKHLSGGNLMKVIIGRELAYAKRALIAYNPTRNLDELTSSNVRVSIREKAVKGGLAVLLVSEDLDEVQQMCDSIYVMSSGRLHGPFHPETTSRDELEKLMVL